VNIGLDVDTQSACGPHCGWPRITHAADNGERQGTTFEGITKRRDVDETRCLIDDVQKGDYVVIAAGFGEVRALGSRLQLVECGKRSALCVRERPGEQKGNGAEQETRAAESCNGG
jgi:hypothetical protein